MLLIVIMVSVMLSSMFIATSYLHVMGIQITALRLENEQLCFNKAQLKAQL